MQGTLTVSTVNTFLMTLWAQTLASRLLIIQDTFFMWAVPNSDVAVEDYRVRSRRLLPPFL